MYDHVTNWSISTKRSSQPDCQRGWPQLANSYTFLAMSKLKINYRLQLLYLSSKEYEGTTVIIPMTSMMLEFHAIWA